MLIYIIYYTPNSLTGISNVLLKRKKDVLYPLRLQLQLVTKSSTLWEIETGTKKLPYKNLPNKEEWKFLIACFISKKALNQNVSGNCIYRHTLKLNSCWISLPQIMLYVVFLGLFILLWICFPVSSETFRTAYLNWKGMLEKQKIWRFESKVIW